MNRINTQGRQNIAPDKIPWAALKTLMAQSIYGGRIDNEFDQRLLNTFLDRIFTKGSFDSEFKLALKIDGHKDLKMPDGIRLVRFGKLKAMRVFFLYLVNKQMWSSLFGYSLFPFVAAARSSCTG